MLYDLTLEELPALAACYLHVLSKEVPFMSIFHDLRNRAACSRVSEEVLYAEALREVEAGLRRDGLWAKALADSGMDQQQAMAVYLKLRVQSLRDELEIEAQHSRKLQARLVERQNDGQSISPTPERRETIRPAQEQYTSELGNKIAKLLGIVLLLVLLVPFLLAIIE